MPTTTSRGYRKPVDADDRADALTVDLAATMDLLDADVSAALWGARNQLTNPNFEIFQRGGTITANNAYAHDRWQILLAGTSTISVTDETTIVDAGSGHSLKAVYVQGSAVSSIDQKLEQYLQLRGKTLTFAVRVRKGVASSVRPYISDSGTKTYGATTTTTGAFETLSVTVPIGAAATSVRVGVELSISDTVYLDNATLGIGTVALPYAPLHPAEELARCQRYYEVWQANAAGDTFGHGHALTTARAFVSLRFIEKAVIPTITRSAASDFRVVYGNANTAVAGTVTVVNVNKRSCFLDLASVTGSPLTAGNGVYADAANTSAALFIEANP